MDTTTPDGYFDEADVTVEVKRLKSSDKIVTRMKDAVQQSHRLVLDLRELRLDRTQASNLVANGLESVGRGYAEVLVIGNGFTLLWP